MYKSKYGEFEMDWIEFGSTFTIDEATFSGGMVAGEWESFLDSSNGQIIHVIKTQDDDEGANHDSEGILKTDDDVIENMLKRAQVESNPERFLKIPHCGDRDYRRLDDYSKREKWLIKHGEEWLAEHGISPLPVNA